MIEIKLPKEVQEIIEGSIFEMDSTVDDNRLAKFLFYVPELIKIYGLSMAELKRKRRELEKRIWVKEQELEVLTSRILLDIDHGTYKNEALRGAKISTDAEVIALRRAVRTLQEEHLDIESDLDELGESYWSFKNLKDTLGDISKLRVAERRM